MKKLTLIKIYFVEVENIGFKLNAEQNQILYFVIFILNFVL